MRAIACPECGELVPVRMGAWSVRHRPDGTHGEFGRLIVPESDVSEPADV